MRAPQLLDSASGLRPLSAFLVIAVVLSVVAGRSVWLADRDVPGAGLEERRARSLHTERDLPPACSILDRDGRPLALSQVRLDLVLSPNAMWQAHTPSRMADAISEALGGVPSASELLERMLPDAQDGVIRARNARTGEPLVLTENEALRVLEWRAAATHSEAGLAQAIDGLGVEPGPRGWVLSWRPAQVLSEDMRARHIPARKQSPLTWSRFLADGLARCLLGPDALEPGPATDDGELCKQRDAVWAALMPTTWAVPVEDFDVGRAAALARMLEEEGVASHQMRIRRERKRSYPAGRDAFLGFWGYVDVERAREEALVELGFERASLGSEAALARAEESLDPQRRARYEEQRREWLARTHPLTGLERACDRVLADPRWDFLRSEPATFTFLQHHAVKLRKDTGGLRTYFQAASEPEDPPSVVTTLDSLLQRDLDGKLEELIRRFDPAVAMAIVVDVESGAVLAVGSRSPYQLQGWAPVFHQFLPGSTFKVPVMAVALETGAVQPWTELDVGDGHGFRLPGRVIREVEQNPQTGILTATECLAYSVNAGLVQIGLQVPPEVLRGKLRQLRYSEKPVTGLGGERPGRLPPLPWRTSWEHASVCFGYETLVTLWQHAAALATVVRGGQFRPLRLLDAVEQGGRRWDLPEAEVADAEVFAAQTCEQVRAMMREGARVGTGRHAVGPERVELLGMGSKTGTAERVGGEACLHHELADKERHASEGSSCSRECYQRLRQLERPHARSCRTLSMAVFGRRPSDGRELLTLVVVDEPRDKVRFGSEAAGPTAVALLEEALGLTVEGRRREVERVSAGFRRGARAPEPSSEQPWAEQDR